MKRSLPRRLCLSSSSCSSSAPSHPSRYGHSSPPLLLGMTKVVTPTSLVVPTRSTTKKAVRDLPSHGQGAHNRESHTCRWVPSSSRGSAFTYSLVLRSLSAAYFEPTPSSFIDFPGMTSAARLLLIGQRVSYTAFERALETSTSFYQSSTGSNCSTSLITCIRAFLISRHVSVSDWPPCHILIGYGYLWSEFNKRSHSSKSDWSEFMLEIVFELRNSWSYATAISTRLSGSSGRGSCRTRLVFKYDTDFIILSSCPAVKYRSVNDLIVKQQNSTVCIYWPYLSFLSSTHTYLIIWVVFLHIPETDNLTLAHTCSLTYVAIRSIIFCMEKSFGPRFFRNRGSLGVICFFWSPLFA